MVIDRFGSHQVPQPELEGVVLLTNASEDCFIFERECASRGALSGI
jgi:hypothetical protein